MPIISALFVAFVKYFLLHSASYNAFQFRRSKHRALRIVAFFYAENVHHAPEIIRCFFDISLCKCTVFLSFFYDRAHHLIKHIVILGKPAGTAFQRQLHVVTVRLFFRNILQKIVRNVTQFSDRRYIHFFDFHQFFRCDFFQREKHYIIVQIFFSIKVNIKCALRNSDTFCEVTDRSSVVSVFRKKRYGFLQDLRLTFFSQFLVLLSGSRHRSSLLRIGVFHTIGIPFFSYIHCFSKSYFTVSQRSCAATFLLSE